MTLLKFVLFSIFIVCGVIAARRAYKGEPFGGYLAISLIGVVLFMICRAFKHYDR